jgi:hypothetical protein
MAARRTKKGGVTEGKDASVRSGHWAVVAALSHIDAIPTIGLFRWRLPVDPKKPASPNEKIPPSEATSQ